VITALSEEKSIQSPAIAGSFGEHVTTAISHYNVPNTRIRFIDVWGWDDANFNKDEMPFLLGGYLGDGFQMETMPQAGMAGFKQNPTLDDMPHVVVIVHAADTPIEQKYFDRLAHFRNQCLKRNVHAVVAMTRVDLFDKQSDIANDPRRLFTSATLQQHMSKVSFMTGFTIGQIFPLKLYNSEYDRSKWVESLAMMPIAKAIELGCRFYDHKKQQIFASPSPAAAPGASVSSPPVCPHELKALKQTDSTRAFVECLRHGKDITTVMAKFTDMGVSTVADLAVVRDAEVDALDMSEVEKRKAKMFIAYTKFQLAQA